MIVHETGTEYEYEFIFENGKRLLFSERDLVSLERTLDCFAAQGVDLRNLPAGWHQKFVTKLHAEGVGEVRL